MVSTNSWSQKCTVAFLKIQREEWALGERSSESWQQVVAGRIRTALRHVAQAVGRAKTPTWAVEFKLAACETEPGDEDGEGSEEEAEDGESESEASLDGQPIEPDDDTEPWEPVETVKLLESPKKPETESPKKPETPKDLVVLAAPRE